MSWTTIALFMLVFRADTVRINRKIAKGRVASQQFRKSANQSTSGCSYLGNPFHFDSFVNFDPSGGAGSTKGGFRGTASGNCKKAYATKVFTGSKAFQKKQSKYMSAKCKYGAQVGWKLCGQASRTPIAPFDIINRHKKSKAWTEEFCTDHTHRAYRAKRDPHGQWTGFTDCYHACQYMFADCEQLKKDVKSCKICDDSSFKDGTCQGVRKEEGDDNELYTFLDACVKGCRGYVELKLAQLSKKKKTRAPYYCMVGKHLEYEAPQTTKQKETAYNFERRCSNTRGVMRGMKCYCVSVRGRRTDYTNRQGVEQQQCQDGPRNRWDRSYSANGRQYVKGNCKENANYDTWDVASITSSNMISTAPTYFTLDCDNCRCTKVDPFA